MARLACFAVLLVAAPALVSAQAAEGDNAFPPPPPEAAPMQGVNPAEPQPSEAPPPPPQAPTVAPPPATAQSASPTGQWVYTSQYGWLWMPYAEQYTYVPSDPQVYPDMYVYYPVYGWRWVVAPWVYGYGPAPYWGIWGPHYFVWYSHPWFRVGGYWGWGGYHGWGYYHGWIGPHYWGAHGWGGAPVYYRTGVGGPHPGYAMRPAPARPAYRHEHAR